MIDPFSVEQLVTRRHKDAQRYAAQRHLLRNAGMIHQSRLPRPGCSLARKLGRILVKVGEQFLAYGQPPPMTLKGQANGSTHSGNGGIVI